jgi:hypothetical protein
MLPGDVLHVFLEDGHFYPRGIETLIVVGPTSDSGGYRRGEECQQKQCLTCSAL